MRGASEGSLRLPSAASAAARTRSAESFSAERNTVMVSGSRITPDAIPFGNHTGAPVLQGVGQHGHQFVVEQVGLACLLAQRLHDVDVIEDFGDFRVGECFGFALEYLAIGDPISHRAPPSGDG